MADAPRSLTSGQTVGVAGVGLNATDTLIPVKQFPERGSKIEIHSADRHAGWSGGIGDGGVPPMGIAHAIRGETR